jgi:pSer/pThr/pTyr-binding forkhead associated (FHA) protein/ribosomal protein L37AE/L43A
MEKTRILSKETFSKDVQTYFKTIGRSLDCDYVIKDPKNSVSRVHLKVSMIDTANFIIEDQNSLNGTFLNGVKIEKNKKIPVKSSDEISLSSRINLDLRSVFNLKNDTNNTDSEKTIVMSGQKTIVLDFNKDKVKVSDILQMDDTPFTKIGKSSDNNIVINKPNISRYHCKMRMITPLLIEVEDLGSTNGTFADEQQLSPNKKTQYSSSVRIRLAHDTNLDLRKIFPNIQIVEKKKPPISENVTNTSKSVTQSEMLEFNELESVWKDYQERQNNVVASSSKYMISGAVAGGIAGFLLCGPVGMALSMGGGLLGRYLGQSKSNELRSDFTYEDMFLQVYSCPRCKESFQKKPWITIRECNKCKLKFR